MGERSVWGACWKSARSTRRGAVVALFLLSIAVAGCGEKGKQLAPVSGLVTFDGQPLAGGTVSFQPVAPTGSTIAGKGSNAICDDQGRYQMTTVDSQPGAVVGEHRVRIYGPKTRQIAASDDSSSGGKEMIPRRYNFDTELTLTVPAEGTDKANFDLTK